MVMNIGRMAVKIAGRDAGKKCVIVDTVDTTHVLVDGETRRKKCNVKHLEPLPRVLDLKKGATHEEVKAAFEQLGLEVKSTKGKTPAAKPVKQKVVKKQADKKAAKPAEKKAAPKQEQPKAEETSA